MTKLCALCQTPLTKANRTKEHIIPNAIGGRKKVRNFICKRCNDKTGEKWDSALANQLQPFCTMLSIRRAEGNNRPFPVETVSGRKLVWNPDGSLTIAEPKFEKHIVGNKTHVTIHAKSMNDFRKMLSGMTQKYTHLNFEELMSRASSTQEYLREPIQMSHNFGGTYAGRSIVKSCLALAHEAGLTIDECDNAKDYLMGDGEACFGYYNETDLIENRPLDDIIHCVYVCADPKKGLVLAYVEYFGFQKVIACLSDTYTGPVRECCYAVNPLTGEELDLDVSLNITQDDVRAIYDGERTNDQRLKVDLERLLIIWKKLDEKRALERAAHTAIKYACLQCCIQPEEEIADEMVPLFTHYFFVKMAPFLLRSRLGRALTAEEEKAIDAILVPCLSG